MKTRSYGVARGVRWLAPAVLVLGLALFPLKAQTPTETKIRLMADALRARDAGELERAREIADQLRTLLPNDPNARRLVAEIDALVAARDEAARNPQPPPMQDVTIPERPPEQARPPEPTKVAEDVPVTLQSQPGATANAEAKRISRLLGDVPKRRNEARKLAGAGRYDEAIRVLDDTISDLPANPTTKAAVEKLTEDRRGIEEQQARAEAKRRAKTSRHEMPGAAVGDQADELAALVRRGRAQYLAGECEAAAETFREVQQRDPESAAAREFLLRIARDQASADETSRQITRRELLSQVAQSWHSPEASAPRLREVGDSAPPSPLLQKLQTIVVPSISFTRAEIGQVVTALSAIAEEYDGGDEQPKGVNIVLLDPSSKRPEVTLTLRNAPLQRVLDFVTESIGYQYEVQADAVVIRPGREATTLDTGFFPVARATVLRMTAGGGSAGSGTAKSEGLVTLAGTDSAAPPAGREGAAVRAFLQQAGVDFEAVPGASLAYDGSALIVTQTPRNLERIRNLLSRYSDVRQVEIEAKFIEVQAGALEELGVNWSIATKSTQRSAGAQANYQTGVRALGSAFSHASGAQQGRIVRPAIPTTYTDTNENNTYDPGEPVIQTGQIGIDLPIVNNAPRLPGGADLAATAAPLANITGVIGEFDVTAVVRALSQQQGTDLLSAPKVTVLSGNAANITVAQEMRYPQSFGQTQSQVGTGNASGGGSAGVAITAGTPQEFTKRNIGVELRVTPTVEEDDYSISLDLNPRVTEFDGFVEYGGPSIAISGSTTVTVPSGFYQPIFSVRDISTRVTIWDGATLVMGGLTREEVKTVNDKVPILGDLPLIGRAFRSKGESAQKRNLLIFVTANLVNPAGAPRNQRRDRLTAAPVNPGAIVAASAPEITVLP